MVRIQVEIKVRTGLSHLEYILLIIVETSLELQSIYRNSIRNIILVLESIYFTSQGSMNLM